MCITRADIIRPFFVSDTYAVGGTPNRSRAPLSFGHLPTLWGVTAPTANGSIGMITLV
ncbi:MAG: hypothetical protein IJL33_01535 [Ruminococcus sp.]|nr:hypothetical protein [Ruminococcus sp.]